MRKVLALPTLLLVTLACEPATGGLKEADEVGSSSSESSASESADDICDVGSLGCACTPGGGCDPGLVCEGDVCSEPGGSSESATTTTDSTSESETGECTQEGCACTDVDGACDAGLECVEGTCAPNPCGNMALDFGEQCDDGNEVDGDGCDNDCSFTEVLQLAAGERHTCALIEGGGMRCWGDGAFGALGYGSTNDVGDAETPASAGTLPLPAAATAIEAGEAHTCALLVDGGIRCWGKNWNGQLGYANSAGTQLLGDDELLNTLAGVMLGGMATQLSLGSQFSCARMADAKPRCWGAAGFGQLGLGSVLIYGDDEHPSVAPMMFLGADATSVAAGGEHACAITDAGSVRCWGKGNRGQLGYGNANNIGDNEAPNTAGEVSLIPGSLPDGTTATQLALGKEHSCALLSTGDVVCWGKNDKGQLGNESTDDWGDGAGELPSALGPILLGADATAITAGLEHSCALLDSSDVLCWGKNDRGQLGIGSTDEIGDDETPAAGGTVDLGEDVIAVVGGGTHTCALRSDHRVVCWGSNADGQLGYGHTEQIGDDEVPATAGFVELY